MIQYVANIGDQLMLRALVDNTAQYDFNCMRAFKPSYVTQVGKSSDKSQEDRVIIIMVKGQYKTEEIADMIECGRKARH